MESKYHIHVFNEDDNTLTKSISRNINDDNISEILGSFFPELEHITNKADFLMRCTEFNNKISDDGYIIIDREADKGFVLDDKFTAYLIIIDFKNFHNFYSIPSFVNELWKTYNRDHLIDNILEE